MSGAVNCTSDEAGNITDEIHGNNSHCLDDMQIGKIGVVSYVRIVIYVAVMVVICGGNILVMIVIARTPHLRTNTNKFVTWLAAADVLVGFSISLRIVQVLSPAAMQDYFLCMCRYYTIALSGCLSGICVLGIAVERYIGVFHSLRYEQLITVRRVDICMAAALLYTLLFPLAPMLGYNRWYPGALCEYDVINRRGWLVLTFVHFVMIETVIVVVYGLIVRETRASYARIAALCPAEMITEKNKLIHNTKAIQTFGLVAGIIVFTWGPIFILSLIFAQDPDHYHEHPVWSGIWVSSTILVLFNSACNPFIYALRMTSFREPMLKQLRWACPSHDETSPLQASFGCFKCNRVAPDHTQVAVVAP